MLARGFALESGAEPVGEFFSVIRQDFVNPERSFCNQTLKESTRVCGALVLFTTSRYTQRVLDQSLLIGNGDCCHLR